MSDDGHKYVHIVPELPWKRVRYACCDVVVEKNDPQAFEKIREHIHWHRMGCPPSDDCRSCTDMAYRRMKELWG